MSHFGMLCRFVVVPIIFGVMLTATASAESQDEMLKKGGVDKKFGELAALDTSWTTSDGKKILLRSLFDKKPVILVPVYFECPMLCQLVLKGLAKGLNQLDFLSDSNFDLLVFSINPNETVEDAAKKKKDFLNDYVQKQQARSITFLSGDENAIRLLANSIGFNFEKDSASGEYVHSAVLLFLSPVGKIMRYMGGIDFDPRSVKLALIETANGKVGTVWDQVLLICYHYNPITGKYGMAVSYILQAAASLTVLCLAWFIMRSIKGKKS